jgi:hypothetical protein
LDPVTFEKLPSPSKTETTEKKKKKGKKANGETTVDKPDKKKKSKKRKDEIKTPVRDEYEETLEGTDFSIPVKPEYQSLINNDDLTVLFSSMTLNAEDNTIDCCLRIDGKQNEKLQYLEIKWQEEDCVEESEAKMDVDSSNSTCLLPLKIRSPCKEASSLSGTLKYQIGETKGVVDLLIPIPLSTFVRKPDTDQPLSEVVSGLSALSSLSIDFEGGLNKFLHKLTQLIPLKGEVSCNQSIISLMMVMI